MRESPMHTRRVAPERYSVRSLFFIFNVGFSCRVEVYTLTNRALDSNSCARDTCIWLDIGHRDSQTSMTEIAGVPGIQRGRTDETQSAFGSFGAQSR